VQLPAHGKAHSAYVGISMLHESIASIEAESTHAERTVVPAEQVIVINF
jgi:hypothetical protein